MAEEQDPTMKIVVPVPIEQEILRTLRVIEASVKAIEELARTNLPAPRYHPVG